MALVTRRTSNRLESFEKVTRIELTIIRIIDDDRAVSAAGSKSDELCQEQGVVDRFNA